MMVYGGVGASEGCCSRKVGQTNVFGFVDFEVLLSRHDLDLKVEFVVLD
jgi:hypothetical protein